MGILKKTNRADMNYELVSDGGRLTSEERRILKLARKIEEKKPVVKELKEFSKIREILMVEIIRKCKGQRERLLLLQHALLYSHKATLEYVIKGAEEYKLFEKIADKEIISECLDDHGNPISMAFSTITYKNGAVQRKTLEQRGRTVVEESIDFDISENTKKANCTSQVKEQKETNDSTGTDTQSHEAASKNSEGLQPVSESSTNASMEQEPNVSNNISSVEIKPFDTVEEKSPIKIVQQRKLITMIPESEKKFIGDLVLEECESSLNTSTIECKNATNFVSSMENYEVDDNQQIYGRSTNASTGTVIQKPNSCKNTDKKDDAAFFVRKGNTKRHFDSKSGKENDIDEKEKSVIQQRQAVLDGSAGVVLLVNSIALYIMKMPTVAVVVGIVGLVCIGFALYNLLKPNTKLEKVEDVEQLTTQPFFNLT